MTKMIQIFLHILASLRSLRIESMRFGEDNGRKLDKEMLEANEIQLLGFSFVEKFDVDVSDQVMDLVVIGQEEKFVIFEEFYCLD